MKDTISTNEVAVCPTSTNEDMALPVDANPPADNVGLDDELVDLIRGSLPDNIPDEIITELIARNNTDETKAENADRIFEGVKAYIDQNKWPAHREDPNRRLFELCFSMRFTSLKVTIRIEAMTETISIITTLPITCLREYRIIMGRHLNSICTPPFGAFHLDEDDGEISHRFTYLYTGADFNAEAFDKYLDNCLIASDLNYVSIAKTATGSMSTKERLKLNQDIKQLACAINE